MNTAITVLHKIECMYCILDYLSVKDIESAIQYSTLNVNIKDLIQAYVDTRKLNGDRLHT
jgi:hypothetical protein